MCFDLIECRFACLKDNFSCISIYLFREEPVKVWLGSRGYDESEGTLRYDRVADDSKKGLLDGLVIAFVDPIDPDYWIIQANIRLSGRTVDELIELDLQGLRQQFWVFAHDPLDRAFKLWKVACVLACDCREQMVCIAPSRSTSREEENCTKTSLLCCMLVYWQ